MALLYRILTPSLFDYLLRISCGIGEVFSSRYYSHVHLKRFADLFRSERKGISVERYKLCSRSWLLNYRPFRTFQPTDSAKKIKEIFWGLCQQLSQDMKSECIRGSKLTIKIKLADFQLRTRSRGFSRHTWSAKEMFDMVNKVGFVFFDAL